MFTQSLSIIKIFISKFKDFINNYYISLFIQGFLLALIALFISIIINISVIMHQGLGMLNTFSQCSDLSYDYIFDTFRLLIAKQPKHDDFHKNILVLGVDSLDNRGERLPLSDTIILLSLNIKTATINSISIPRDLYSEAYQTKINALYAYSIEKDKNHPTKFVEDVMEETTNIDIDHTVVIRLDELSRLIDLLGGVEVYISEGFIDNKFPRSDVDINSQLAEDQLYETIEFRKGEELMTGPRALKYIRSRHSAGQQGTDLARASRQQQLISAIINKLIRLAHSLDPCLLGELVRFYLDTYDQYISTTEVLSTLKFTLLNSTDLKYISHSVPIDSLDSPGIIYHPSVAEIKDKQWVYKIKNKQEFTDYIYEKLGINSD